MPKEVNDGLNGVGNLLPGAGVGAAAVAAEGLRPMARRDDLAYGRAPPEPQAAAAKQQVR